MINSKEEINEERNTHSCLFRVATGEEAVWTPRDADDMLFYLDGDEMTKNGREI